MTKLNKISNTKMQAKANNQTQDDVVYCYIFDAILEQRLPPNTKLNEESLSEIFGVSRTIIRRALLRLSLEQVVDIKPNKGATVSAPTIEDAIQILKAREITELAVTELATENCNQVQLQVLRNLVTSENEAIANNDIGKGIRLSGEFHIELAKMAKNAPLLHFLRSLVSQTSLLIAQYEGSNNSNCSQDEHSNLLNAIEAGNKEEALHLMDHHMQHIRANLNLNDDATSSDLHVVFSDIIRSRA
ncbi:GntR family transcriptional regulator [Vibrio algicola]|uniref:FCD domain-containing protein n=1 Tax=Vibrio algicola TaxID=2662262 RepID=A0A5Q0TL83_9VIBR|nr:GntR family transcriptional regulator [Vibrio algicola]